LPRAPRFPLSSNDPRGTVARDGSVSIATSARIVGHHVSAVLHRRFRIMGRHCWYLEDRVSPRTSVPSKTPRGSSSHHLARGSSRVTTYPRGSGSCLPAQGSSGAATCHLGSSTHHLVHGSSRAATCPEDGFCRPQANKQISPDDQAIMISIRACTSVSSKTLRDKGCSTCSQSLQQATH
jgi:hypothetical protein